MFTQRGAQDNPRDRGRASAASLACPCPGDKDRGGEPSPGTRRAFPQCYRVLGLPATTPLPGSVLFIVICCFRRMGQNAKLFSSCCRMDFKTINEC